MILRGSLFSEALEMTTGVTVILPGSAAGRKPRPVCYLLHGLCGGNGDFAEMSRLPLYAMEHDAVFVMPEAARSFYSDMARGQKFFTYVADELPALVADAFNVSTAREDTAVMGVSMGGYGALKCALSRPERYGKCAAFSSPCLYLGEGIGSFRGPDGARLAVENLGEQLHRDFLAIYGDGLELPPESDIPELARRAAARPDKPAFYAACGDKDGFLEENRRFAADMKALGFDFTYKESPGGHDWRFFDAALEKALRWCYAGTI